MVQRTSKSFRQNQEVLTNIPIMALLIMGQQLKLYISTSNLTIGCILAQDDDEGSEKVVHYLNRLLNDVKTKYSLIKKSYAFHCILHAPSLKAI